MNRDVFSKLPLLNPLPGLGSEKFGGQKLSRGGGENSNTTLTHQTIVPRSRTDISPTTKQERATQHYEGEIKQSRVGGCVEGDENRRGEGGKRSIKRNINQLKHIHFLPHSRFYQKTTLNFVVLAAAEI